MTLTNSVEQNVLWLSDPGGRRKPKPPEPSPAGSPLQLMNLSGGERSPTGFGCLPRNAESALWGHFCKIAVLDSWKPGICQWLWDTCPH